MRALVLLVLLAPLAAAEPRCVQLGCVDADDQDADGVPDRGNVALSAAHAGVLNVNVNRTAVIYEVAVTTEETVDPFHTVALLGHADGTREADAYVEVNEGEEETGRLDVLAWTFVWLTDSDDDGRADDAALFTGDAVVRVHDADGDGDDDVTVDGLP